MMNHKSLIAAISLIAGPRGCENAFSTTMKTQYNQTVPGFHGLRDGSGNIGKFEKKTSRTSSSQSDKWLHQ
jgi:hypothetical protein